MTRLRVIGMCVLAALTVGTVIAVNAPAAAKKTILTLQTAKGALPNGSPLQRSSSDTVFTTSAGNIECTETTSSGTLNVNNGANTLATFSAFTYKGSEEGGLCKTTTPYGPAEVIQCAESEVQAKLSNKLQKQEKGNKKLCFTATFPAAGGASCTYTAGKVKSTFNNGGTEVVTTTEQKYKLNKKISNAACPVEGKLSGHTTLSSSGEPVEAVVH